MSSHALSLPIICRPNKKRLSLQVQGALATVLFQQEEEPFSPQLHQPNQGKALCFKPLVYSRGLFVCNSPPNFLYKRTFLSLVLGTCLWF